MSCARSSIITEIIVAIIRNVGHVVQAAIAGGHIAAIPVSLLRSLWKHPLNDIDIGSCVIGAKWVNELQDSIDLCACVSKQAVFV
ncbi:hypothetical protein NNL21_10160 [Paenibacillus mendelii]|nr:hypothetical protein [Paenibacillus mendelii]